MGNSRASYKYLRKSPSEVQVPYIRLYFDSSFPTTCPVGPTEYAKLEPKFLWSRLSEGDWVLVAGAIRLVVVQKWLKVGIRLTKQTLTYLVIWSGIICVPLLLSDARQRPLLLLRLYAYVF